MSASRRNVVTFKDNPGRRLISLWAGSILGLVIAGCMGLDVLAATVGTASTSEGWTWGPFHAPNVGVLLTGLVMGLGANPTHELIRTLQEIKKSRKLDNGPTPVVDVPSPVAGLRPTELTLSITNGTQNGSSTRGSVAAAAHTQPPAESSASDPAPSQQLRSLNLRPPR